MMDFVCSFSWNVIDIILLWRLTYVNVPEYWFWLAWDAGVK